jgi:hypothetical protein
MISKVKNILPPEINKHIITKLCNQPNWCFPHDAQDQTREEFFNNFVSDNISNSGFSLVTYDQLNNIRIDTDLNLYAEIIFYKIKQELKLNLHTISRIYWNYYDTTSVANYHVDRTEPGYKSIIYNIHTNDGGTRIRDRFFRSNEGEAIVFDSDVKHKGIAPSDYKHRFNLNIICSCAN